MKGYDVNYYSCSFDLCVVVWVGGGGVARSCLDLSIRTTIGVQILYIYGHTHLLQKKARKTNLFLKYSLSWGQ